MGVEAVEGRTAAERRGAVGATNPDTAVRHTTKNPRNFIVAVKGWCVTGDTGAIDERYRGTEVDLVL